MQLKNVNIVFGIGLFSYICSPTSALEDSVLPDPLTNTKITSLIDASLNDTTHQADEKANKPVHIGPDDETSKKVSGKKLGALSGKQSSDKRTKGSTTRVDQEDEDDTDFVGLIDQFMKGDANKSSETSSKTSEKRKIQRQSFSNSMEQFTTPKVLINNLTDEVITTAIPLAVTTIVTTTVTPMTSAKPYLAIKVDDQTVKNSSETLLSNDTVDEVRPMSNEQGPDKAVDVKPTNESHTLVKMIVTKGNINNTEPILLKFSNEEPKHTIELVLKKNAKNGTETLSLRKKENSNDTDDDSDDEDAITMSGDDEDEDDDSEDKDDDGDSDSSDDDSEPTKEDQDDDDDNDDKEVEDEDEKVAFVEDEIEDGRHGENEVEEEEDSNGKRVPFDTLSGSRKVSQAGVYTTDLEDVPKADAQRLQDLLRKYFIKPRHWPYNQSNTWHIQLLQEFKSYGLKTFVQENNDLDKFWFYNEHKRDTELVKYPIVNVIGILPGKFRGQANDGILIVGAHYDTLADSPGVDDNGSGMAVLLETARVLANSNYTFESTIFFVAFDRKEQGFGGSGLFVLEYLIPAELLLRRGFLQGAFIVDTVMNYDPRPRSQSIPKSVQEYSPEATKVIRKNKNRGDFLTVISRSKYDDHLTHTFMDNWKRINDTKYKIMGMSVNGTGNIERDDIFYKGYYFFASDHIYFWYPETSEFNGTLPSVRLFDTGIERGRMRKCHHRACDNSSFITEDNLQFLKKSTDALILTLIDLGKGSTMVQLSGYDGMKFPWNYFMYMGSAILSGTAFLSTTISKMNNV